MSSHGINAPNLGEEEMFPEISSSFFSIICSSVVKSKLNNIRPEVLQNKQKHWRGRQEEGTRKGKNFNYKLTNNKT